ncbi:MAG: helix-turn-helix domain-containing protein [Chloroflexota bacterium]|nr:helix-turn-helix domain-containing protein [Chloroflexota bacterium]MDQ5865232.1 helix-turn-helix domain-containing protein [Chloroflexota bacterium]
MNAPLTLRDLTLPGEPLDGAMPLTGEVGLDNPVTWVASLRPFSPAFPRLRGGEIALVATENLMRHDPPITLADVVRLLSSTRGAGLAVRGGVNDAAVRAAEEARLALLSLPADAPLADLEQAIMRECAFHQARTEISRAEEPESWLEDLLSGRDDLQEGAVSRAERQGYALSRQYAVAFVLPRRASDLSVSQQADALANLGEALKGTTSPRGDRPVAARYDDGLAVLLPQGSESMLLRAVESTGTLACGIGTTKPLLQVTESLKEAQLAATASALVLKGAPSHFANLGPLHLLLLLHRDQPRELVHFVNKEIGSLMKHDTGIANPLLPTVEAFIRHGGRLRETAEHLVVHRNTLAYRLQKAEEILGADLKEPDVRLGIELALLALPLLGNTDDLHL